jgi:hypothetical protein
MIEKLRMSRMGFRLSRERSLSEESAPGSSGGAHYIDGSGGKGACAAALRRGRPPTASGGLPVGISSQQAHQLGRIQLRSADHCAIQQKHGDVQSISPGELRVGLHIDPLHGRQGDAATKLLELRQHFLAKTAVFAVEQRQCGHPDYRGDGAACRDIEGIDWRDPPS